MMTIYGTLFVYSSGHRYAINGVDEETANVLLESFHNYQAEGGDVEWEDHYPDGEHDYYLVLAYGKIDALAFELDAA
jgi:hypothetical protein